MGLKAEKDKGKQNKGGYLINWAVLFEAQHGHQVNTHRGEPVVVEERRTIASRSLRQICRAGLSCTYIACSVKVTSTAMVLPLSAFSQTIRQNQSLPPQHVKEDSGITDVAFSPLIGLVLQFCQILYTQ